MNTVKKSVARLREYGVSQETGLIKLNQNESPYDIPLKIKRKILSRMEAASWNRYPLAVPESFMEKLSAYAGFPSSGICIGNGSNELIQTLVYAFCDTGDRVVVVRPGFSIYKRVCDVMNIPVTEVSLKENFSLDVGAIIARSRGARLLILSSPNNPTGICLPREDAERLSAEVSCPVIFDEAYHEFSGCSFADFIDEKKPLFVLRTFSKAFRLAGLRLGYLLGTEKNIRQIGKAKLPFSVGLFSQIAGEIIMEHRSFLDKNLRNIIRERERLYGELSKCPGLFPIRSEANFILIRCDGIRRDALFRGLYHKGILVRRFDENGLESMIRVTVGKPEENDIFLKNIRSVLKEEKS